MRMDKTPGGELDNLIKTAIARSGASLAEAHALLDAGFPGPAFVWAVRSIEIYVKEVMLLPLFLEETHGDEELAWRKARELFDPSKWARAIRKVDEVYGPLEPMTTEDGKNVWDVWKSREIVGKRGDVVHGRIDATAEETSTLLVWAEQMKTQLTLRLITAGKHPLHDLLVAVLQEAGRSGERERHREGG